MIFFHPIKRLVMGRITQRINEAEEQYRQGIADLKKKLQDDKLALADKLATTIIDF